MKYIAKKNPPEIFTHWKNNQLEKEKNQKKLWKRFRRQTALKKALYQSLLEEQGYLCCYCGRNIEMETSHIEHLKTREKYPQSTLDYQNLLASCPGYDKEDMNKNKSQPEHCGHYKDDQKNPYSQEDLKISPLDKNCESFLNYDENGNIFPIDDQDQDTQQTITQLGLNTPKLKRLRKKAMEGVCSCALALKRNYKLLKWYYLMGNSPIILSISAIILRVSLRAIIIF